MSVFFRKSEGRALSYSDVWGRGDVVDLRGDALANALTLVPVYAATSLIADQIAATPWSVFEKTLTVPVKLGKQPALVSDPGVGGLDLFTWKHQALASCLLRGNAYGLIIDADSRGVPSKVQWLHPDRVTVNDVTTQFFYDGRLINRAELIHIPGYVMPGSVKGLSPLTLFRMQVETGMQAQKFGKNFFKRGGIPSADLKYTPKGITSEVAKAAKDRFVASVSASEPFVHGADWEYQPITVPAGDAQFLSGIKATATQIAAAYRVAPEDVGGETGGTSLTYKSLEQDQIRFAVRTLRPWTERFEAVINRYLPANQYVKFNLDSSARADLLTRYQAHQVSIGAGFETLDEVRAMEDRPPLTADELAQYMALSQPLQKVVHS